MNDTTSEGKLPAATAPSCQVCGEPLTGQPVVVCHRCRTPHHRDCWRYNRGCSVFGCGCRTSEAPAPASGADEPFTVEAPASRGVFAALLTAAIATLLAGIGLASFSPWVLAVAVPGYILFLLAAITWFNGARAVLTADPAAGVIRRRISCWGRTFGTEDPAWVRASDIVEVHLHRYDGLQNLLVQDLYLALADGSRRRVRHMTRLAGTVPDPGLEEDAERLAAFADTTVRIIETREAPSPAEFLEAARHKELPGPAPDDDARAS